MGESPTQHGNNDQHIQYVSDMLYIYLGGYIYIYIGAVFLSISCMEELVKRTCEDFTKEVTPDSRTSRKLSPPPQTSTIRSVVSATQPFVQRSQTGFQTLARARTMSLALGGLPSVLPQDKLAELKETAAKLCAPGRVW